MIVHNSMALDNSNKYGFRVGQVVEKVGKIAHITKAGEIIFSCGKWDNDWEMVESYYYELQGNIWKQKECS